MAISKLRRPNKDTERAIMDIYDKLNEIIDAVNQPARAEGKRDPREKIRMVKAADGSKRVEFNFGEEWYATTPETLRTIDESDLSK